MPNQSNNPISIEHAPQRSASSEGVERCLTCVACNNERGFEKHSAPIRRERIKIEEWCRRSGSDLALPGIGHSFANSKSRSISSELLLEMLLERTRVSGDDRLFELSTAYFVSFSTLGYSFAFDEALAVVRTAILNEEPVESCVRVNNLDKEGIRIGVLQDLPCILVPQIASHSYDGPPDNHYVIMPRPGAPKNFYERLANFKGLTAGLTRLEWSEVADSVAIGNQRLWDRSVNKEERCGVSSSSELGSLASFYPFRTVCDTHGAQCIVQGDYLLPLGESGVVSTSLTTLKRKALKKFNKAAKYT